MSTRGITCWFHFHPFSVNSLYPDLDASVSFGLLYYKDRPLPLRASTPYIISILYYNYIYYGYVLSDMAFWRKNNDNIPYVNNKCYGVSP